MFILKYFLWNEKAILLSVLSLTLLKKTAGPSPSEPAANGGNGASSREDGWDRSLWGAGGDLDNYYANGFREMSGRR